MTWDERAACREVDPDLMFPETRADAQVALRVCAGCPVLEHCAARAERIGPYVHGVWAGVWHHGRASRAAKDRENQCVECARRFLVPARSSARLTCSDECRQKRRAASDRRSA